ncbi:unnamed protein product [Polarella glacialis]|nr:unnamed protein product [Polarella glacialis]
MTPDLYGKYGLCDVNASAVNCGSPYASTKLTYAEMVEEQNLLAHRTDADGNLWACGCEQGWLADWVCPLNLPSEDRPPSQPDYFSISYFIATAPGTGAMAAVSVWGVISYWIMGPGSLSFWQHVVHGSDVVHAEQCDNMSWGYWLSTITLFIFQITFGFFLMNPVCIVPWLHTLVVTTFIVAAVIHFLTIAVIGMYNTGLNTTDSKIIVTMVLIAVIPLLTTVVVPSASWPGNFGLYAFYYAECLGLSVGFNIPSVLFLTTGQL